MVPTTVYVTPYVQQTPCYYQYYQEPTYQRPTYAGKGGFGGGKGGFGGGKGGFGGGKGGLFGGKGAATSSKGNGYSYGPYSNGYGRPSYYPAASTSSGAKGYY